MISFDVNSGVVGVDQGKIIVIDINGIADNAVGVIDLKNCDPGFFQDDLSDNTANDDDDDDDDEEVKRIDCKSCNAPLYTLQNGQCKNMSKWCNL